MQRGDSCSSSFSSSDMDMERQEASLVEKYGALRLKNRVFVGAKTSHSRKYFDSADYSMQREGKVVMDPTGLLVFDCPIDQLPVKAEPTAPSQRQRSHMDHVGWAQPIIPPINQSRTVIDI